MWHFKANESSAKQLIAQDRHDDARHILLALLPKNKPDEDFVNREMSEIQHAMDEEREAAHGSSYKALLKNGPQKFFYRTMLGIGGQFMQQLSYVTNPLHALPIRPLIVFFFRGINLITYYSSVICRPALIPFTPEVFQCSNSAYPPLLCERFRDAQYLSKLYHRTEYTGCPRAIELTLYNSPAVRWTYPQHVHVARWIQRRRLFSKLTHPDLDH